MGCYTVFKMAIHLSKVRMNRASRQGLGESVGGKSGVYGGNRGQMGSAGVIVGIWGQARSMGDCWGSGGSDGFKGAHRVEREVCGVTRGYF